MGFKTCLAVLIILYFTGGPVSASECCLSYTDALSNEHDAQFCSDYCCGEATVKLFCCSTEALRAPASERADYCILWWSNHVWAPILLAIFCLAILIGCCVCCYKCCCSRRNTTVVVQHPSQPAMSTTVVNSTNMMATAAYPPPQGPSVPPPYAAEFNKAHAGYDQP